MICCCPTATQDLVKGAAHRGGVSQVYKGQHTGVELQIELQLNKGLVKALTDLYRTQEKPRGSLSGVKTY